MGDFNTYTDNELWQLIKDDNYGAFDELVNRYWQPMFNNAYKRIAAREVCEDLVQEVFIHIWARRSSLEIENPIAYLQSAIRYRVYTHFSRNKFTREFIELFDDLTDAAAHPENQLKYKELRALIRAWINTLPEKRAAIFRLYIEDQMTTREIADRLNITQKTVQNQLNRSFGSLRTRLSGAFPFLLL